MSENQIYVAKVARGSASHRIRGVDYHVSLWGDDGKPLLVYAHGWGDAGSCFQFVVDEFLRSYRIVALDWRGFGGSQHRAQSYWFPDYVADLHELLQIYSPGQPARLVGHSMGANIISLYAGIFPERVAAFVNVEGFGLADSEPGDAPDNYRTWIEKSSAGPAYRGYESFEQLAERVMQRCPRLSPERALFVAKEWARQADDGSIRIKADPAHKLPNAVQYRRAEAIACWDRVTAPVLLVMGKETDFTSASRSWIDPVQSQHPFRSASNVIIPDAGHMVHFEQPARLAATIENFFTDL